MSDYTVQNMVKETSTSTGTGTIVLAGAVTGFQSFDAALGSSALVCYEIAALDICGNDHGTALTHSADLARALHLLDMSHGVKWCRGRSLGQVELAEVGFALEEGLLRAHADVDFLTVNAEPRGHVALKLRLYPGGHLARRNPLAGEGEAIG